MLRDLEITDLSRWITPLAPPPAFRRQRLLLHLPLPRETAAKFARLHRPENSLQERLTFVFGVSNLHEIRWKVMPDQPSPDKVSLSVRVPRTLAQRLKRQAQQRGETLSDYLTWLFTKATADVELSPDDYRQIAEDTERALKLQAAKRGERQAFDARFKKREDA